MTDWRIPNSFGYFGHAESAHPRNSELETAKQRTANAARLIQIDWTWMPVAIN
jgi:hypothetical protein